MQFRAGDTDAAADSWGAALELQPTLTLNPVYEASDVGAAWEDARASAGLPASPVSTKPPPSAATAAPSQAVGTAAGAPTGAGDRKGAAAATSSESLGEQPTGDFLHDPAPEQRQNTPLPIHVEYGGDAALVRVLVKYNSPHKREWARVELKRVSPAGNVWEGMIPCADVGSGTLRYWLQGFNRSDEPVAETGSPKHPFHVAIRDKITGEAPRLPGKAPPQSCDESDCPPGLAGCKADKQDDEVAPRESGTAGAAAGPEGAASDEAGAKEKKEEPYQRLWLGVGLAFDYISLSAAIDVCRRDSHGNAINSVGYYCYDSAAGTDFPPDPTANATLKGGGTTTGGFQLGNTRVMLALDYAVRANFLAGARLGYVFNAYPGTASVHFLPLHIEVRGTYLLGSAPLAHSGLAPLGFAALGLSEFDGHQTTLVTFNNGSPKKMVDTWLTDAPLFVAVGVGLRYQLSRVAITGAFRLNLVIGNGLMSTIGPELGALYAF
jgi:hypothetical protein